MTHDEIVARLEKAGRTLLMLPPERGSGHVKPRTWDHLMPGVRAFAHSVAEPVRLVPSPRDIDDMDRAFLWLGLIPQDKFVLRRIVAARSLVSPITGRHIMPWRRIAGMIGADHKAVQRWHALGIGDIARAMPNRAPRSARASVEPARAYA
jgi:hypothetical protein